MHNLLKPFKNASLSNVTQGYNQFHRAIDWLPLRRGLLSYGTPLVAPERVTIGKVYDSNYDRNNPHDDAPIINGYGLWMKGETGLQHLYWHTQPTFPVSTGDVVERGTIVAYCGNSGNVTVNGQYVPIEQRDTPNYLGTHLHQQVGKYEPENPLDYIDLDTEPDYTIWDELKAIAIVLGKISKLLSS